MPLTLELNVEERYIDRVIVVVRLQPSDLAPVRIEGASVQICTSREQCLGPKLLLPVRGELTGPLLTTAELRVSDGEVPPGSLLVGRVWTADEVVEITCPTDPWTELEGHLRGSRTRPDLDLPVCEPQKLSALERERLAGLFPWIRNWTHLRRAPADDGQGENLLTIEEDLEAFASDLGLDAETTDWLRDLLEDDVDGEEDEDLEFDL